MSGGGSPAATLDERYDSGSRVVAGNGVLSSVHQGNPSLRETMTARRATIERRTAETDIRLSVDLDGSGDFKAATGVGFFEHMLHMSSKEEC